MALIEENVFTHVLPDGSNVCIWAERLRQHCLKVKPEVFWTPVTQVQAVKLIADNTVDKARVMDIAKRSHWDPIIYCKDGTFTNSLPDVFLVDGHHRYVAAAACKVGMIEAWVLEVEFWAPFKATGLSVITAERLKSLPITRRDY